MFKVQLTLIAAGLLMAAGSQVYSFGFNKGIASIDQEAFDSYAHFAEQMQRETHHTKPKPQLYTVTVWTVVDGKGK